MEKQTSEIKRITLMFSLFITLLSINCSSSQTNSNTSTVPVTNSRVNTANANVNTEQTPPPPETISAVDLIKAYKKDKAAAEARYKGKTVIVTGEVNHFSVTGSGQGPDASLRVANGSKLFGWTVFCTFLSDQAPTVGKLKQDQTATFKGRIKATLMAGDVLLGVDMDQCILQ